MSYIKQRSPLVVCLFRIYMDCEQFLFVFAKLLHAKPKHAGGEAARNEGVSLFSSRLNCNNNVVVCNRAGWDKN